MGVANIQACTVECDPNPVPDGQNAQCIATAVSGFEATSWTGCDSFAGSTCYLTDVTEPRTVQAICEEEEIDPDSVTAAGPLGLLLSALGLSLIGGWRMRRRSEAAPYVRLVCTRSRRPWPGE